VLVFDNMKTVTSGRDAANHPLWTPAILQFAAEFGFHPQACDPGAGNQKGSVESLVKWVKGNFLPGREFADDTDLASQSGEWTTMTNRRPSSATGVPPVERLGEERAAGGGLPATAWDYGLLTPARVAVDATVAVEGNRYSVPVEHVRAPVTVRLHAERVRIWRDTTLLADHPRAAAGCRQRIIEPTHFAPLFESKPRARAMLYREVLLTIGDPAEAFIATLSQRQCARLPEEVVAVYGLYEQYGATALRAAMQRAGEAGTYSADALALLLTDRTPSLATLALPGIPSQTEIDRWLGSYETWVQVEAVQEVQA
jgi:hypothetical protein